MFPPVFNYNPSDYESDDDYSHEYGSMVRYFISLKISVPIQTDIEEYDQIKNDTEEYAPSVPKADSQSVYTW